MMTISEDKKTRAQEVITKGFLNSAKSLEFFLKEPVRIEGLEIEYYLVETMPPAIKDLQDKSVLYSEIFGEIKGECLLIFNENEVRKIAEGNLGAEASNTLVKEAFLLEIDNIITASVVTEISNALKIKFYGGVPQLIEKDNINAIERKINSQVHKNPCQLKFRTNYRIDDNEFSPEFVWFLDKVFLDKIDGI